MVATVGATGPLMSIATLGPSQNKNRGSQDTLLLRLQYMWAKPVCIVTIAASCIASLFARWASMPKSSVLDKNTEATNA